MSMRMIFRKNIYGEMVNYVLPRVLQMIDGGRFSNSVIYRFTLCIRGHAKSMSLWKIEISYPLPPNRVTNGSFVTAKWQFFRPPPPPASDILFAWLLTSSSGILSRVNWLFSSWIRKNWKMYILHFRDLWYVNS